jgi:hypothetical protein
MPARDTNTWPGMASQLARLNGPLMAPTAPQRARSVTTYMESVRATARARFRPVGRSMNVTQAPTSMTAPTTDMICRLDMMYTSLPPRRAPTDVPKAHAGRSH